MDTNHEHGTGQDATSDVVTSKYPEHDKLRACLPDVRKIQEFTEFLSERGMLIVDETFGDEIPNERIIELYFDIDQEKIDAEKDAMVQEMRAFNDPATEGGE